MSSDLRQLERALLVRDREIARRLAVPLDHVVEHRSAELEREPIDEHRRALAYEQPARRF